MSLPNTSSNRLLHIEGLRAVAVVAVVLNHLDLELFQSGFIGVDVFFVISGFVITKYLTETHFQSFSQFLGEFFSKRMKRLIPALVVCVYLTTILFISLTTMPTKEVFKTGAFSLVGISNFYLHDISTNYFSIDAKLNPFTHTWSLGVEEQFYLIFPMLLAAFGFIKIGLKNSDKPNRYILPSLILISFILWIVIGRFSPSAQFYLLPYRMWELASGSLCLMLTKQFPKNRNGFNLISAASLASILILTTASNEAKELNVCLVVLTTNTLLFSIKPLHLAHRILASRILILLGMLSYSIYLWHWPFIVLTRLTLGLNVFTIIGCGTVVLIFSLLSYFYVERPLHKNLKIRNSRVILSSLFVTSLSVLLISAFAPKLVSKDNNLISRMFDIHEPPKWADLECHGKQKTAKFENALDHCLGAVRTKSKPHVIYLVGDSHSAQYFWMVQNAVTDLPYQVKFVNLETDIPQYLRRSPLPDLPTFDFIFNHGAPGDLVVFSISRGHLNDSIHRHIPMDSPADMNEKAQNFIKSMDLHIKKFKSKSINLILVRDSPLLKVVSTSASCLLQIKLFGKSVCQVDRAQDLHTRKRLDVAYNTLAGQNDNIFVWDAGEIIFGTKKYFDVIDDEGNYLMLDWNHITQLESERLAPSFRQFLTGILSPQSK